MYGTSPGDVGENPPRRGETWHRILVRQPGTRSSTVHMHVSQQTIPVCGCLAYTGGVRCIDVVSCCTTRPCPTMTGKVHPLALLGLDTGVGRRLIHTRGTRRTAWCIFITSMSLPRGTGIQSVTWWIVNQMKPAGSTNGCLDSTERVLSSSASAQSFCYSYARERERDYRHGLTSLVTKTDPLGSDVKFHNDGRSRCVNYQFNTKKKDQMFCPKCGASLGIDFRDVHTPHRFGISVSSFVGYPLCWFSLMLTPEAQTGSHHLQRQARRTAVQKERRDGNGPSCWRPLGSLVGRGEGRAEVVYLFITERRRR